MTPITPLLIDTGTFDRMFVSIKRGLPFVYVNYGMSGANTPITPYGSLALLMAEILAGITLSQLVQEGAKAFSPKLAVYADEVIAQARRISKGFEVDDGSIMMQEISAAGPAGNFLSSDLTLKQFRQAYFQNSIFPSFTMEDWNSDGRPKAEEYLSRHTIKFIKRIEPAGDFSDIMEKSEIFIKEI